MCGPMKVSQAQKAAEDSEFPAWSKVYGLVNRASFSLSPHGLKAHLPFVRDLVDQGEATIASVAGWNVFSVHGSDKVIAALDEHLRKSDVVDCGCAAKMKSPT